jgi:hypothetical protein
MVERSNSLGVGQSAPGELATALFPLKERAPLMSASLGRRELDCEGDLTTGSVTLRVEPLLANQQVKNPSLPPDRIVISDKELVLQGIVPQWEGGAAMALEFPLENPRSLRPTHPFGAPSPPPLPISGAPTVAGAPTLQESAPPGALGAGNVPEPQVGDSPWAIRPLASGLPPADPSPLEATTTVLQASVMPEVRRTGPDLDELARAAQRSPEGEARRPAHCAIHLHPQFRTTVPSHSHDPDYVVATVFQRGRGRAAGFDTGYRDGVLVLSVEGVRGVAEFCRSDSGFSRMASVRFHHLLKGQRPGEDDLDGERARQAAGVATSKRHQVTAKHLDAGIATEASSFDPATLTDLQCILLVLANQGKGSLGSPPLVRLGIVRARSLLEPRAGWSASLIGPSPRGGYTINSVRQALAGPGISGAIVEDAIRPTWGGNSHIDLLERQDAAHAKLHADCWPLTDAVDLALKEPNAKQPASAYQCAWPRVHWRIGEARWTGSGGVALIPFTLSNLNNSGQPPNSAPNSMLALAVVVRSTPPPTSQGDGASESAEAIAAPGPWEISALPGCLSAVSKPFVMVSCNSTARNLPGLTNKKLALMPCAPIPPETMLRRQERATRMIDVFLKDIHGSRASPHSEQSLVEQARPAMITRCEALRFSNYMDEALMDDEGNADVVHAVSVLIGKTEPTPPPSTPLARTPRAMPPVSKRERDDATEPSAKRAAIASEPVSLREMPAWMPPPQSTMMVLMPGGGMPGPHSMLPPPPGPAPAGWAPPPPSMYPSPHSYASVLLPQHGGYAGAPPHAYEVYVMQAPMYLPPPQGRMHPLAPGQYPWPLG